MPNEICILCGNETNVDINTHVDHRIGYIEGAGQLCISCYRKGDSGSREQITIPKKWVLDYPNDSELGSKVRAHYWSQYSDVKPNEPITCKYCGRDTSEVEYDYLNGTDHLECCLKQNK